MIALEPCARCGRIVPHQKRPPHTPAPHYCPHELPCNDATKCLKCRQLPLFEDRSSRR